MFYFSKQFKIWLQITVIHVSVMKKPTHFIYSIVILHKFTDNDMIGLVVLCHAPFEPTFIG